MNELTSQNCVPCRGGAPTLSTDEIEALRPRVSRWTTIEEGDTLKLRRRFKLKNFKQALDFTQRIGEAAEQQNHHPTVVIEWGAVTVTWWTHKISGLHRNDFIMAAQTDELFSSLSRD